MWTETDAPSGLSLSGILAIADLSDDGKTVDSSDVAFTGSLSDEDITLNMDHGLGFESAIVGVLVGDYLTLYIPSGGGTLEPTLFHSATVADFNRAVNELHARVEAALISEEAFAAADEEVRTAVSALESVLSDLEATVYNVELAVEVARDISIPVLEDSVSWLADSTQLAEDDPSYFEVLDEDLALIEADRDLLAEDLASVRGPDGVEYAELLLARIAPLVSNVEMALASFSEITGFDGRTSVPAASDALASATEAERSIPIRIAGALRTADEVTVSADALVAEARSLIP